ncbi:wd-repeat protein [Beauveria bassiana ARSEF 2860]|uniref:Wd-repeat protein n=1 Tax=Beauveria bassiana (strain ARSEF 2860) TaxID=655819 RepID=J5J7X8_BEAB2|nr:wd-repeat protein [Beauveria bassiana ARSEF 2860]EJP62508.1 wd-repeat protein [Beauveria bassiana ARSEF 2860]
MASSAYGGCSRIELLLAQVKAEFAGQQLEQVDDWHHQWHSPSTVEVQLSELQSLRQTLNFLQRKHKTETAEYQSELRNYEEIILCLETKLASRSSTTSTTVRHDSGSAPDDQQLPDAEQVNGNATSEHAATTPTTPTTHWADLPPEIVPAEYKLMGSDWYALFNPRISQRLKMAHRYTIPHDDAVCCVRFSRDNRYLATASQQTVKVFDAETGTLSVTLEERHDATGESLIRTLCFSPDDKFIATGSEDNMVRVWEIASRKIRRFLSEHTAEVYTVECASDNRSLVSGSRDGTVKVWHVNRSKARYTFVSPDGISSVSVSADMAYVIASSHDASIYVWSMQTGQRIAVLSGPSGHTDSVYCLTFLPTTAACFASGSLDCTVKVWKLRALLGGSRPSSTAGHNGQSRTLYGHVQTLHGHTDYVVSICATPDACWILSGGKDRSCRIWDAFTGELQLAIHAHSNTVLSVAASNQLFATAGGDNIVRVWSYSPVASH